MSAQLESVNETSSEDKRSSNRLSEADLERIAQRAADIVWRNFELRVGQATIRLVLYVAGTAATLIGAWLFAAKEIKL